MTHWPLHRILVPTDLSKTERASYAEARARAAAVGAEIVLLHAAAHPIALGSSPMSEPNVLFDPTPEARAVLDDVARTFFAGCRVRGIVKIGTPAHVILEVAGRERADLIVLRPSRRRGLDRLFTGDVTQAVARAATCPVLLVPPDGGDAGCSCGSQAATEAPVPAGEASTARSTETIGAAD